MLLWRALHSTYPTCPSRWTGSCALVSTPPTGCTLHSREGTNGRRGQASGQSTGSSRSHTCDHDHASQAVPSSSGALRPCTHFHDQVLCVAGLRGGYPTHYTLRKCPIAHRQLSSNPVYSHLTHTHAQTLDAGAPTDLAVQTTPLRIHTATCQHTLTHTIDLSLQSVQYVCPT